MTFPCRRLALALLLLAVGACRGERHPRWPAENRLTIALESAPAHLDTRVGTDQASDRVFDLMACGLVAKAPNGDLVPSLASTWELLDEGRRYRFHLRPDARFHDGRPVEAADVAATFGSLLDGSVVTSKRGAFTLLRKVEAVDPQTVDFVLESPSGPFLYELSSALGILPRGTGPQEQNARPIGCGPFRLVSRTPERLLFRAFDGAFGGRPILDEVELKVVPDSTVRALELLKGSVQLVINDLPPDLVPPFRANPDFQVVEKAGGSYAYLGLNLDDPALSDVRVRRALALSIDRERLVATIWRGFGVVTETMIPPGSWARISATRCWPAVTASSAPTTSRPGR
ncbi:MAG TPA: ABC transporter substrate-binding protein [Thermoanaerobaculia bacterium]|nr:ABC transporter substrate-binding protein [Thermoanaerobaculia bacterium]